MAFMKFKDRIKAFRVENKMTQLQLATRLGKTEGAIRAWEDGRSKPDVDTLIELAKIFDCTSDFLLGLSDYKNKMEENEIATSSNTLDEAITKISGGSFLLKNLALFVEIVDKKEMGWIASKFLATSGFFLQSLMETAKLADEIQQTQDHDITRVIECMFNTIAAGTNAEKNMQIITTQLLHDTKRQIGKYVSKSEGELIKKLFDTYRERQYEVREGLDNYESLVYTNKENSQFDAFFKAPNYSTQEEE